MAPPRAHAWRLARLLALACLTSVAAYATPPAGRHRQAPRRTLEAVPPAGGARRKLLLDAAWFAAAGVVQKPTGQDYDIGSLAQPVNHLWVDPVGGSDEAPGTVAAPLRSLTAAWDRSAGAATPCSSAAAAAAAGGLQGTEQQSSRPLAACTCLPARRAALPVQLSSHAAAQRRIPDRANLTLGYHIHLLSGVFTGDMSARGAGAACSDASCALPLLPSPPELPFSRPLLLQCPGSGRTSGAPGRPQSLWRRRWGRAAPRCAACRCTTAGEAAGAGSVRCTAGWQPAWRHHQPPAAARRHLYFLGLNFIAEFNHPLHVAESVNVLLRRQGGCWGGVAGCSLPWWRAAASKRTDAVPALAQGAGDWRLPSWLPAWPVRRAASVQGQPDRGPVGGGLGCACQPASQPAGLGGRSGPAGSRATRRATARRSGPAPLQKLLSPTRRGLTAWRARWARLGPGGRWAGTPAAAAAHPPMAMLPPCCSTATCCAAWCITPTGAPT